MKKRPTLKTDSSGILAVFLFWIVMFVIVGLGFYFYFSSR
jgi:hypothetical protein